MEVLAYLIPAALFLGCIGLAAFVWALKTGQFDDMDGAAMRILLDDDELGTARDQTPAEENEPDASGDKNT